MLPAQAPRAPQALPHTPAGLSAHVTQLKPQGWVAVPAPAAWGTLPAKPLN